MARDDGREQDQLRKLDEIRNGDRPNPFRILPKVPYPDTPVFKEPTSGEEMRGVDALYTTINAYLANRFEYEAHKLTTMMFDWIVKGGYWPVPFEPFDIAKWPQPPSQLYGMLCYINSRWRRLKEGEE